MRLYWEVARRGFGRHATYVGATLAGLFTNTFFGFFRSYTFIALFSAAGASIGGFDLADTLTYAWLTQALIMTVGIWGWWEIAERISTGDIVTDLFRPYDFQAWWLAQDLGRALYQLLARGIVPLLVGALAFELRLPTSVGIWLAGIASITLAVVVSFAIRFLANLWTFWTLDHRGVATLLLTVWSFSSGFIVPLTFLPDGARQIVELLPFAATVQIPIEVLLGKHMGADLVGVFMLQAFWAAALLFAGRTLLAVATRRVVTQGG